MSEAQITKFSEFSFYVTAQIDRINSLLQDSNHFLVKVDQINALIKRQENKIQEVDTKVRLLEVYQSQNFKNNERLFNSQLTFDALDKKISVLQKIQAEIIAHSQEKMMADSQETQQRMHLLEQKIKIIQNEVERIRGRNMTLSKFRRDVSPTIVNCDSTKDISVDRKSNCNNNELKKMEARIHQYINQKIKIVEKRFYSALNADRQKLFDFEIPDLQNESFVKNRLTEEKNKEKSQANLYHINRGNKKENAGQNNFRNAIDSYYNQTTQKQDGVKRVSKQGGIHEKNQGKTQKSNSKSKSKNKLKNHSSKKSISLKSVSEYLKLTDKTK